MFGPEKNVQGRWGPSGLYAWGRTHEGQSLKGVRGWLELAARRLAASRDNHLLAGTGLARPVWRG